MCPVDGADVCRGNEGDRVELPCWADISSIFWKLENFCLALKYYRIPLMTYWITIMSNQTIMWEILNSCFGPGTAWSSRLFKNSFLVYCEVTMTRDAYSPGWELQTSVNGQVGNGLCSQDKGSCAATGLCHGNAVDIRWATCGPCPMELCFPNCFMWTLLSSVICVLSDFSALGLWSQWSKRKKNWTELHPQSRRWPRPCCFSLAWRLAGQLCTQHAHGSRSEPGTQRRLCK